MRRSYKLLGFAISAAITFIIVLVGLKPLTVIVGLASGFVAIAFFFAYIDQAMNELHGFTSRRLLKATVYFAVYGIIITVLVVEFLGLNATEAIGVFTVTAEGLGFIGLSLVEITIFYAQKEVDESKVPKLAMEYDPSGTPDLFVSQTELVPATPQPTGAFYGSEGAVYAEPFRLIRRSLRVVVRNTGRIAAESCTAELRVIEVSSPAVRRPSAEPKGLLWETGQETRQDLAALAGHAVLNVAFSDTRLSTQRQPNETSPLFALVATPDSVHMNPPQIIRAQDGFGRGEFIVELAVIAKNGAQLSGRFRIRVTDNWEQLSMERIS